MELLFLSSMWMWSVSLVTLFAVTSLQDAIGSYYEFVPDNEQIFEDCPKQPNVLGIHGVFNLTLMTCDYIGDGVMVSGYGNCIWEGVEPTDRISMRAELYKFQRGTWQPTLLSAEVQDYCKVMLDESSVTYHVWTSHIAEEDRLCFNNYGHVYHHEPFMVNTTFKLPYYVDGRLKIVVWATAFDLTNVQRQNSICVEIPGQLYKLH